MVINKKEDQFAKGEFGLHVKPAELSPAPARAEKEKTSERPAEERDEAIPADKFMPQKRPSFLTRQKSLAAPTRDEVTVKIEKIMEEGLGDSYQRLSPIARQEFKLKGEQTAGKVRELLKSAHVKVKKIFRLIFEWLKMLPGVNTFFLEQEAKIKTDKIILLKKRNF